MNSNIKWNRRNIAATMEKYEPTVKHRHSPNDRGHVTMSSNNHKLLADCSNEIQHSDYAYAYYEPGAPMRHRNIPTSVYVEAGSSSCLPPNSIRALLSAKKNNMQRANDNNATHSDGSQSGQRIQENVYEEIHETEKQKMLKSSDSIISLNQSLFEEEFRRVHNRHQRVLGELNLSVEEMLMPPQPTFIPTISSLSNSPMNPMDFLGHGKVIGGSNGAGNYNNNLDLDSGFSGSNSSYIGSLRYQKSTVATGCSEKKTAIDELPINRHYSNSGSSFYGSSTVLATNKIGIMSSRSSSHQSSSDRSNKISFWKGKGWKNKIPGFSSTSSINKTGEGKQNFE